MARMLMMTTKEKGHVNPMMGVAQWLQRHGHHVGWLCLPDAPESFGRLGFEVVSMEQATPPRMQDAGSDEELITGGPALAALVRQPDTLRAWIKKLLLDAVPDAVEPTRAVLRAWRPDVLVVDPMLYQGIIAAHLEGIVYACVSSSLNPVTPPDVECSHTDNMRILDPDRRALFARYGMSPECRVADCLSPTLNIVFTTREYVGDVDVPANTELVGPSVSPAERGDEVTFPWWRLGDARVIYASFGSQIYFQPEIFEKIAHATAPLDARLVLSCGPLAESEWAKRLPDHVVPVSYAPQREILQRAALFLTHGGANSVMEALCAGVPIIISPVCNDQPMQAYFVERAGTGEVLDLSTASARAIFERVGRLLDPEASARRAAAAMQAVYATRDGGKRAAELIEGLLA